MFACVQGGQAQNGFSSAADSLVERAGLCVRSARVNPRLAHGHADVFFAASLPVLAVVVGKTLERVLRLKNNNETAVAFKVKVKSAPTLPTLCD